MKQLNYDLEKCQIEIYSPYRTFPLCQREQDKIYNFRTLGWIFKACVIKDLIFWDSKD